MNIERLTEIAEWLEGGAIHTTEDGRKYAFMMDFWDISLGSEEIQGQAKENGLDWIPGDCGSAMCIGGATEQFFGDANEIEKLKADDDYNCDNYAGDLLGLNHDTAYNLFYPWSNFRVKDVPLTPERAAKVIYHLINTGKVDWTVLEGVTLHEPVEEAA